VIHFHKSGSTAAALGTALDANVTASMWGLTSDNCHISHYDITPLDGSSVTYPVDTGSPAKYSGAVSGTDVIPQACYLMKLLTLKRGRSYRGRIFLPFLAETKQSFGTLDTTAVSNTTAAWVAFHTAMTSAGFDFVVASYKLATADNVAAIACESQSATQRRRARR
jgi:hypothetical protein